MCTTKIIQNTLFGKRFVVCYTSYPHEGYVLPFGQKSQDTAENSILESEKRNRDVTLVPNSKLAAASFKRSSKKGS